MTPDWETLIPVLVHIQANLEGDLSLRALARKAGLSQFHFQRRFKAAIGESPKDYTLRLRLERAAFRLLLYETSVLGIAIDCGFRNHETFSRAFRRRFGASPIEYRGKVWQQAASWLGRVEQLPESSGRFEISETRVVQLRPAHIAFRRHVGPYETVPESLFDELAEWAQRRGIPGPPVWMGIGHDSPSTTPPERLRFDAGLLVPGPFAPEGRIAYQSLPGGHFAVTTHAGPYSTLPAAYEAVFSRLMRLSGYQIIGLPAIEVYHAARVCTSYELNHTDICLPIAPRGGGGLGNQGAALGGCATPAVAARSRRRRPGSPGES